MRVQARIVPRLLMAVALIGGMLTFAGGAGAAPVQTQQTPAVTAKQGIAVTGVGHSSDAQRVPTVVLGVSVQAGDAATAQAEGQRALRRLQSTLSESGIAKQDVRIIGLRITPERSGSTPQFRCMQMVAVDVPKAGDLGKVLDTALRAGATSVHSVHYRISLSDSGRQNALKEALQDAQHKASATAAAMGVHLGKVKRVVVLSPGYHGMHGSDAQVRVRVVYSF